MISFKITVQIIGFKHLNISNHEFLMMKYLTMYGEHNKPIKDSKTLTFDYKGPKKYEEAIKQTIAVYFFLEDIKVFYGRSYYDYNKIKGISETIRPENKRELEKPQPSSGSNNNGYVINIESGIGFETHVDAYALEIDFDKTLLAKIFNLLIDKDVSKYMHLFELVNYSYHTHNLKIKYLSYFIIIEALANYNYKINKNSSIYSQYKDHENKIGVLSKIKGYLEYVYNKNEEITIFDTKPLNSIRILYDLRSSLVHEGDFKNIEKKSKRLYEEKGFLDIVQSVEKLTNELLMLEITDLLNLEEF